MLLRADAMAVLVITVLITVFALFSQRVGFTRFATALIATCMLATTGGAWLFGARLAINRLERAAVTPADGWGAAWSVLGTTMVKPYLLVMAVWTVMLVILALRPCFQARNA